MNKKLVNKKWLKENVNNQSITFFLLSVLFSEFSLFLRTKGDLFFPRNPFPMLSFFLFFFFSRLSLCCSLDPQTLFFIAALGGIGSLKPKACQEQDAIYYRCMGTFCFVYYDLLNVIIWLSLVIDTEDIGYV